MARHRQVTEFGRTRASGRQPGKADSGLAAVDRTREAKHGHGHGHGQQAPSRCVAEMLLECRKQTAEEKEEGGRKGSSFAACAG